MQNNYQNILECIDILSVAFVIGLAMEDAPPRKSQNSDGGEGSESGEDIAEEGDDDDEDEEEKALLEDVIAKMGLPTKPSVTPAASPNSPPTPGPERSDGHHFLTLGVAEGETSGANSREKNFIDDNEGIKKEIKEIVDERVEYECSTTLRVMTIGNSNSNLKEKKIIDSEKKSKRHRVEHKDVTEHRGESDLRAMARHDDFDLLDPPKNTSKKWETPKYDTAYFLHAPQQSSRVCVLPVIGQDGNTDEHEDLLSNTEREHETDQGVTEAEFEQHVRDELVRAPAITQYGGTGLHSNSERELESEAAIRDANMSNVMHAAPESPRSAQHGLHSNTVRELVGPAAAREAHTDFDGTDAQKTLERQAPKPGHSGQHSNTERELAAAGTSGALFNAKNALHSNTKRQVESEGAARESVRRPSQRSLIGSSVAAALNMNPIHYMGTASKPSAADQPPHKRERKLSQRTLVGHSYATKEKPHAGSSKGADNSDESRLRGGQKRKLSQNDLLGLAHAALRDIGGTNGARPSNAPQPSPRSDKNKAPGLSYASQGQRIPSPDDDCGSSCPAPKGSAIQMDVQPSIDAQTSCSATVNEDVGSQSTSHSYSSDSGQHRYAAQRDFNNTRRFHPYEQPQTSTQSENTSHEEEEGDRLGSSEPSSETQSGFFTLLQSGSPAPDPDPNPDPDDDGDGKPKPMPEHDPDSYPPSPPPDEDGNNNPQPIPVDDIDNYPPPPPPDENVYNNPQPISNIDYYTNNYILESQYLPYPPIPLPMFPWPWNPPNEDYFSPMQIHTSELSSVQAPQHPIYHPSLRVRHQGDRMLYRRPRCGLLIVTDMRRDKSLPVDRRKNNRIPRTPGRVDVTFVPRVGDIILRHVRLPGQGAVEIWYPGLQTQDGDSLVRFKLDPFSYDSGARESSNLLIVKAKGYIIFEDMWIYMGRATHSVIKAEQRVLGIGAMDGQTIYAR